MIKDSKAKNNNIIVTFIHWCHSLHHIWCYSLHNNTKCACLTWRSARHLNIMTSSERSTWLPPYHACTNWVSGERVRAAWGTLLLLGRRRLVRQSVYWGGGECTPLLHHGATSRLYLAVPSVTVTPRLRTHCDNKYHGVHATEGHRRRRGGSVEWVYLILLCFSSADTMVDLYTPPPLSSRGTNINYVTLNKNHSRLFITSAVCCFDVLQRIIKLNNIFKVYCCWKS